MVCHFRETVNRFGTRSSVRDWLALEKHPVAATSDRIRWLK